MAEKLAPRNAYEQHCRIAAALVEASAGGPVMGIEITKQRSARRVTSVAAPLPPMRSAPIHCASEGMSTEAARAYVLSLIDAGWHSRRDVGDRLRDSGWVTRSIRSTIGALVKRRELKKHTDWSAAGTTGAPSAPTYLALFDELAAPPPRVD